MPKIWVDGLERHASSTREYRCYKLKSGRRCHFL